MKSKILKTFLLLNFCLFTTSFKAHSVEWYEDLLAHQKPQRVGNKFPIVSYKARKDNLVDGAIEDRSTAERMNKVTYVVVPGAFTPTCSSKHINHFVETYNNEESTINKLNVATYVIARNDPDVMAAWATHLGSKSRGLQFIPDPNYVLLRELGVLALNPRLGLIGNRSIFYVDDGKIVKMDIEADNAKVCETSVKKVVDFWSDPETSVRSKKRKEEEWMFDRP